MKVNWRWRSLLWVLPCPTLLLTGILLPFLKMGWTIVHSTTPEDTSLVEVVASVSICISFSSSIDTDRLNLQISWPGTVPQTIFGIAGLNWPRTTVGHGTRWNLIIWRYVTGSIVHGMLVLTFSFSIWLVVMLCD